MLIAIDQAYAHCSKAFLRSQLWDPDRYVSRDELPTSGEIHRSTGSGLRCGVLRPERAERYARREGFY